MDFRKEPRSKSAIKSRSKIRVQTYKSCLILKYFGEIILTTPNKIFVLFDRVATTFALEKKNQPVKNKDIIILPPLKGIYTPRFGLRENI
jgi:hypothetical protein